MFMKNKLVKMGTLLPLFFCQPNFAAGNDFFQVNTTGTVLQIKTTKINRDYPDAGIKINTPGYSFTGVGTTCTPQNNGFCLFSVGDKSPASMVINGPRGVLNATLCLYGRGPLSCQNYDISMPKMPRFAYVADVGRDNLIRCNVVGATQELTDCAELPGVGTSPNDITFNKAGTFAYVQNGFNVDVCRVNPLTGDFSNCITTPTGVAFSDSIALNPAGTLAYMPDGVADIIECIVNPITGLLSSCGSAGSGFTASTIGTIFNPAGTFVNIGDFNAGVSTVSLCSVNTITGALSACSSNGSGFNGPNGFALNTAATFLYVANFAQPGINAISLCQFNASTGALSSCAPTGDYAFSEASNIALNAAAPFAYITDFGNSSVIKCNVNTGTGAFSGCAPTGGFFFGIPAGIALYT